MKAQDLLIGAAVGGAGAYFLTRTPAGDGTPPESIQDWLARMTDAAKEKVQEIINQVNPNNPGNTNAPEVSGFTLQEWAAAAAQGVIPITAEQLTERWTSAAQMSNPIDAISLLFSGQTVDIDTVIAAMGNFGATYPTPYEYVPIDYLAQYYGGSPYYLPAGTPLSYLYSGTAAANVLLGEALSGAWANWSQPEVIQHISDVRGF
jgi:hypothetical protein